MTSMLKSTSRHTWILLGFLWISANLLLLVPGIPGLAGLLILAVVLPGLLGVVVLLHGEPCPWAEFTVYLFGLGFTFYVLTTYALSLLPGPLVGWQVVLTFNAFNLFLAWLWPRAVRRAPDADIDLVPDPKWSRWNLFGLVSVLIVGTFLRVPGLGYSEFYIDEARVVLSASEVVQGYENALFSHRKGPAEILIPTGAYAVQQRITESQARLPFLSANLVGLLAVYLLGWRLFGAIAGWTASMLLAMDGFLVAFARFVQYQSIVFLMSAVIVLALLRQARRDRPLHGHLWIAALCFVGGLYAHYEMLLVIIPGLYLLWWCVRRTGRWGELARALVAPALMAGILLAVFYAPFILDENWRDTADHLFTKRIGGDFPYNHLADFFARATVYNSTYAILFLIVTTVAAYGVTLRRALWRPLAWTAIGLIMTALAVVFVVDPKRLQIGNTDLAWIVSSLAIAVLICSRATDEQRVAWLWFGPPMLLSLFFVKLPNTHVYTFFIGWALIVGSLIEVVWNKLDQHLGGTPARLAGITAATGFVFVFSAYTFQMFAFTGVEVLRTWSENSPWGFWRPLGLPRSDALYAFPFKNGWKVVGALYAQGVLTAPFDTNESSFVGVWYGRGDAFCPPDAEYYMLATPQEPGMSAEFATKQNELTMMGYQLWGYVTVNDSPRLHIYSSQFVEGEPQVFREDDYSPEFDAQLSSPYFVKAGPAVLVKPEVEVSYRMADTIWLKGYSLSDTTVRPGQKLKLDLFWMTTQRLTVEDKVFVQLIELESLRKIAQHDAEPGCNRHTIEDWRSGDLNFDPYVLTIAPDAPPGRYTLLVGMYDRETEDRYPVYTPDGARLGDAVQLSTIQVETQ